MKLKNGFVLRSMAGENVVIPSGADLNLNMMITLNDTGRFLWERLEKETTREELISSLLENYEVDRATAENAVDSFVANLEKHGFLV